jgi:hypothetical protein
LTIGSRQYRNITHDFRRIYAGANDFDAYFCVVFDDLLVRQGEVEGEIQHGKGKKSEFGGLTWSWEV